jgi:hypothetical protein
LEWHLLSQWLPAAVNLLSSYKSGSFCSLFILKTSRKCGNDVK